MRFPLPTAALVLAATTLTLTAVPSAAAPARPAAARHLPDGDLVDLDARGPRLAPRSSAQQAVNALGGDLSVAWGPYGLPSSIATTSGWVGTGLVGAPADAARAWVRAHRDLFGLTGADVDALELLNDTALVNQEAGSPAHAVLFRQTRGSLHVVQDGMIALGLHGSDLAVVTSSAVGSQSLNTGTPTLTPLQAVAAGLADAGRPADPSAMEVGAVEKALFVPVTVPGYDLPQRARLVAVPTTDRGLRLGWETSLIDGTAAHELGVVTLVDAVDGSILRRHDAIDHYADADPVVPPGTLGIPTFTYFENAPIPDDFDRSDDVRITACQADSAADVAAAGGDPAVCDRFLGPTFSRYEWDVDVETGLSTMTTRGNNAQTATARLGSTLTPAEPYSPVFLDRNFTPAFDDAWRTARCNPTELLSPTGADADASTVNLFTNHNIAHDFSYRLGFTENTYNLQLDNLDQDGVAGDPQIGNVQSGATTDLATEAPVADEFVGGLGRDNANQIVMQDGIPAITNQYLFQPLTGFYAPCVDGDLDANVFVHEYTHATSNRMIAGPDTGIDGAQGGSMGESWSDQVALELVTSLGTAGQFGDEPTSSGAYSTGALYKAFLNYPLGKNPLAYGDLGYDVTDAEVHSDGELWSGTNWAVRQALVDAWESRVPYEDADLQQGCVFGSLPSTGGPAPSFDGCPGNRRWIQYVFDSFLLQATGDPTFIDMKNNMLAAASMRGSDEDRATMARVFANRGLGTDAATTGSDDTAEVPGLASPTTAENSAVTFSLVDGATGAQVPGNVFLGAYQARVTPYLTLDGTTPVTKQVAAGTYEFLVQAPGFGLQRVPVVVAAGGALDETIRLDRNYASAASGATADGDLLRPADLIDDDEATNAVYDGSADDEDVAGKQLTVDLHGTRTIGRLALSALSRPVDDDDADDVQGRFINLRAFDVTASTDGGATYHLAYASPDDFFPATRPRPTAPELNLRTVAVPAFTADHLKLVVRSNQCTGQVQFQGDQDDDPLHDADCLATAFAHQVAVTELEAFAPTSTTTVPVVVEQPPVVVLPPTVVNGPPTAAPALPRTGLAWGAPVLGALLLGSAAAVRRRRRA